MTAWDVFWASLWQGLWEAYLQALQTATQVVAAVGMLLTAAVALYAAIQSRRSAGAAERSAAAADRAADETRRAAQAQLMSGVLDSYAEPEMHRAMYVLRAWRNRYPEDFARQLVVRIQTGSVGADELNDHRRRFSHHVTKVLKLHDGGYVDKEFVELAIKKDAARFFLEIIEPINWWLAKSQMLDYNDAPAEFFARYYRIPRVGDFPKLFEGRSELSG